MSLSVSIRGGQFKVLETVDTPLQILDVSTDGKYALAQNECHAWDDRHDVEFSVFELETKKVIFKRKFLHDSSTSTWYVSPVGQFMPQHTDQVLLAHQESKFVDNCYDCLDLHFQLSSNRRLSNLRREKRRGIARFYRRQVRWRRRSCKN